MSTNWDNYYKEVPNLKPRPTTLEALKLFKAENHTSKKAIDLGCGNGRDTLAILEEGFFVLSIDSTPGSIEILDSYSIPNKEKLELKVASFENLTLPENIFVNASYSLPFCKPDSFQYCWNCIVNSIEPNGRFAGHFFGNKDEWAKDDHISAVTKTLLHKMFEKFEFEMLKESEWDGESANQKQKHWHVFEVVAKKKNL